MNKTTTCPECKTIFTIPYEFGKDVVCPTCGNLGIFDYYIDDEEEDDNNFLIVWD
jgi:hypothetical protein